MQSLIELTNSVSQMPAATLVAVIILAGFGLAAYAIHAVRSAIQPKDRS